MIFQLSSATPSKLLVKFAGRAGNENAAGNAAFPILHPFGNTRGLAALGAVGALGGVHYFLAVCGLGDFGHVFSFNLAA